jgi:DNA-binding FadR family transcriptional regulator
MSRRFYYLHHRQARDLAVATRHHIDVIRAVAIGDEMKAAAASDRLMDYVEEFTRATVSNRN